MAAIEALLQAVLGLLGTILGILGLIKVQTADVAQQSTLELVQAGVTNANDLLADPTYGLAALQAMLVSIQGPGAHSIADVLTAVGTPQQAGVAVTLPNPAPAGYGGASAADAASAVWSYVVRSNGLIAADALAEASVFAEYLGASAGVPLHNDPKFLIVATGWYNQLNPAPDSFNFAASPANILPADSVLTWLNRETGLSPAWAIDATGYPAWTDPSNSGYTVYLPWSTAQFEFAKDGYPPPSSVHGAPVWPGLAGVTLGAPVALSQTFTVAGPMDGCIIAVTSAPPKQAFYTLGTQLNYRHLGAIAFVDDNGDAEVFQLVGWQHGVFLPLSMEHASSVIGRTEGGTTGTITPFTVN